MIFFQKVRNRRNWILSVPRVSVRREKKSPWLRQYQSYISNWYVNGKVFTSTTTWEPIFFFKKVRNWIWLLFWLVLKSWNQHSSRSHLYVYIGDASSSLWGSTSSLSIIPCFVVIGEHLSLSLLITYHTCPALQFRLYLFPPRQPGVANRVAATDDYGDAETCYVYKLLILGT